MKSASPVYKTTTLVNQLLILYPNMIKQPGDLVT